MPVCQEDKDESVAISQMTMNMPLGEGLGEGKTSKERIRQVWGNLGKGDGGLFNARREQKQITIMREKVKEDVLLCPSNVKE